MLERIAPVLIEPTLLAVYLVAAGAMILSPGPDTLYVLTRSVGDGRDAGIASAVGISVGVLVHTFAAVVGLSAVFRASELAFTTVTVVGAGYLVYLGVRTIRDDGLLLADDNPSAASPFREAVLVNVLNPQVALFFLAFLPQFVDRAGHVPTQLSILGAIYALVTMGYLATVAVGSSAVRRVLFARPRVADGVRWLSGLILVGLGVRLLLGSLLG
ncbi:LysE family translocator [Natronorubrum sp. DTA7]|uniref:LysE family translocator n=1 Tax=Natronorubrum sp. DTA7 TaxID=3447016 RepID=UPI003F856B53